MAVVFVHEGPTLTRVKYEEAVERLTGGRSRLESPADWTVDGLLVHTAGQAASGFRIVDVWESEDACRRFGEKLMPVLQELGITDQPELYPAHTFVKA
jgi:hypothetical protein